MCTNDSAQFVLIRVTRDVGVTICEWVRLPRTRQGRPWRKRERFPGMDFCRSHDCGRPPLYIEQRTAGHVHVDDAQFGATAACQSHPYRHAPDNLPPNYQRWYIGADQHANGFQQPAIDQTARFLGGHDKIDRSPDVETAMLWNHVVVENDSHVASSLTDSALLETLPSDSMPVSGNMIAQSPYDYQPNLNDAPAHISYGKALPQPGKASVPVPHPL